MEQVIGALRKAFADDIQSLPWMSDDTKRLAEAKLEALRQKIGYPDHWRDYSGLTITRTRFIADLDRAAAFQFAFRLGKVGVCVASRNPRETAGTTTL
jgi:putative endopeptidase